MSPQGPTVLVLGGDGYCGWPVALRLSARGYNVTIIDNLVRRRIDDELGTAPLAPIATLPERLETWQTLTTIGIAQYELDIATDYATLRDCIAALQPATIVHFAEQRSAPYSMLSSRHKRYTVANNVTGTHNLLACLVEAGSRAHVVHLGSIGVYGYSQPHDRIPEGYITLGDGAQARRVLYPVAPDSVYHLTKALDQELFAFYCRNDGLAITDLHQGIVWGSGTPETDAHPHLGTRFDYDGEFGTVVNRFLVQAAIGQDLSVYGSGGQTRGFIHLADMVRCVEAAVANRPAVGDTVRIVNQISQTMRIRDLAALIASMAGVRVGRAGNPRAEADENVLPVDHPTARQVLVTPTVLDPSGLAADLAFVRRHAHQVRHDRLATRAAWR